MRTCLAQLGIRQIVVCDSGRHREPARQWARCGPDPRALGYVRKPGARSHQPSSARRARRPLVEGPRRRTACRRWLGASLGYPALVLDPAGAAIDVNVFESIELPAHWARLDAFEGPGYQRVVTTVHMPTGDVDAYIYVLLQVQD
jgi:gamma-glutamylcyclotransferase (GGCT)/AIG2-like uncharacterized protein YtfP